jgi:hypothetical protein
MAITDAEKQARFRKKEVLKRAADQVFRQLQLSSGMHHDSKTPRDHKSQLDQIADLPSGWTDEDWARAMNRLQQYLHDIISMPDQLKNDVDEGTESGKRFMASNDPRAFLAEESKALQKTRALAAHLISAINLSDCNEAEKAAAVMELVREVGKAVMNLKEIPQSAGTAVCIASLGPHYMRPDWFPERFAKVMDNQLNQRLGTEVCREFRKLGGPYGGAGD